MKLTKEMFRFTAASTEQNDDTYGKNNDDQKLQQQQDHQQQHRKRDTMIPENFNMNFGKWNKQSPMGDGDCRRSFIPALRGANFIGSNDSNSNKVNWRMMSQMDNNNVTDRKRISIQESAISGQHCINNNSNNNNDESDDTDNNSNRTSHPPHLKYQTSSRTTDSLHSKISSHSFNVTEDNINESMHSYFSSQHKKSSTMLDDDCVDETLNSDGNNTTTVLKNSYYTQSDGSTTEATASTSSMNFIMLLGLIVGLVISKALQYLQLYFKWFQAQVKQLRIAFIGHGSVLEFFNFDDTSRYGLRTKLLLMPLVGAFSLLYGVIALLHFLIRFFLTQAPCGLVSFIQKLYTEV